MSSSPLITVVMPVYNAERYLQQAIDSIQAQTLVNWEMIIYDDESTDASRSIIEQYARRDQRIRPFYKKHAGYVKWLNEGIALAKGELIARMDADDISHPTRFESQAEYLKQATGCVAVGSWFQSIDADGDVISVGKRPATHEAIEAWHLGGRGGAIMHPAVMYRKRDVEALGGYRSRFEPAEDYDLFLRLGEIGRLANIEQVLLSYRLHSKSVSYSQSARQVDAMKIAIKEAYCRRGLRVGDVPDLNCVAVDSMLDVYAWWARLAYDDGNIVSAWKYAKLVALNRPLSGKAWSLYAQVCEQMSATSACSSSWRWVYLHTMCRLYMVRYWAHVVCIICALRRRIRRIASRIPILWRLLSR